MSKARSIPVTYLRPTYDVCVVGIETAIDIYRSIPRRAEYFDVRGTSSLEVTIVYNPRAVTRPQKGEKWPLNKDIKVVVSPLKASTELNDSKVKVSYYGGQSKEPLGCSMLYLTNVAVCLDVDIFRIGSVTRGVRGKDVWTWGRGGKGAILLVNCDRDRNISGISDREDTGPPNAADVKDMSPMVLTAEGPDEIFDDYKLTMKVSSSDAKRLRVYQKRRYEYAHVLGKQIDSYDVRRDNLDDITFYVEGLEFPDIDFSGLVYIDLTFHKGDDGSKILTEQVVFRVAPWIMTPNTQKPLEVYVCNVKTNSEFVKLLSDFVDKTRCPLNKVTQSENRGDQWIQDEMEFGYTEAPHKRFPVVLDSPRNRGLRNFPVSEVLGPDFGHVTREPDDSSTVTTLDSFGNLEVSPPVVVNGKAYPLGRILIGDGLNKSSMRMNQVLRDFLHAQQVQAPVFLFSTWLYVGHIDEFMTFVPAPNRKGFRLLLASPQACLDLFRKKQKEGHGGAVMFEGLNRVTYTIDDILASKILLDSSKICQESIDQNRKIMKKELGLSEDDIIDIPMLYKCDSDMENAESFFPNMVNMLVLGKQLGIPKPFGPKLYGTCCLEEKVRSVLEPLGLNCTFLDDFTSYHQYLGEVHCGTNVVRKPFSYKWWECIV
ncbi:protein-arginine deiminase type-1-like isoform X1 [Hyla sarda]|uniref:protein-arginine deiminase type-1-like isoform X1 n=2 Tax=Hyla sarda TaxID=327740 RepID=UPI0024C32D5B|nr:protein-arginine deiminase type-1-like isoform X1 [Hyla sarda]